MSAREQHWASSGTFRNSLFIFLSLQYYMDKEVILKKKHFIANYYLDENIY